VLVGLAFEVQYRKGSSMSSMKLAVTGATGFVGSHFLSVVNDADIRVLARRPERAQRLRNVAVIEGALDDRKALRDLVIGMHCVVHCAGLTSAAAVRDYDRVNGEATARLVGMAAEAGVKRFILISSLAAREPGLSAYGASKRRGEDELRARAGDMAWVILRPPAVYGPGDKGTLPLIRQLTQKRAIVPGNPKSRFSLIHVSDLARAIEAVLTGEDIAGGIFELHDGAENGYSWAELADLAALKTGLNVRLNFLPRALAVLAGYGGLAFARLSGRRPFATPGKIRELYHKDWVARHNLLDQATGWTPEIGFVDGFAQTVDWYRAEGWL
jgi:nucleoside-diphosphate-sugar epimerase